MKAKATLKQIAKELGVSVSTVSKALNRSPEISEPTKQRVQEYALARCRRATVVKNHHVRQRCNGAQQGRATTPPGAR